MRRTNLPGHALQAEGAAYKRNGDGDLYRPRWNSTGGTGMALCECGETSGVLESGGERRRWHAAHKDEAAAARCSVVATVGADRYPCRSHEGGVHHFAAHWPACPAPFCKQPPDHRGLHDIPSGKAEYVNA
jgi:hypothetical protein